VHVWSFSALTVFTWDGNPNKLTVGPTTKSGIRQELWCNLWRSRFRHYLCAHLNFRDQLSEWQTRYSRPLFEAETYNHDTQSAVVSLVEAFVEFGASSCFVVAAWHLRDSGGSVINHNPQFFTTFIVRAAGVKFHGRVWYYIISSELVCMYVYIYVCMYVCIYIYIYIYIVLIQWRFVREVPLPRWCWYFFSVFTDRVSSALLSHWRII
jgi:hypothetical protein